MELKYNYFTIKYIFYISYNWTLVELKYLWAQKANISVIVIIEP